MNQAVRTLTSTEAAIKIMGRRRLKELANVARIADHISAVKKRREGRIHPTPERLAKGDVQATIDPVDGRRYGPRKNVVDHYVGKWDPAMEVAFMRLVEDSRAADVTGVTIDYFASGSRSAGGKMGGLGAATARKIQAFHYYQFVMDRVPPRARRVLDWLLLPRDASDRPMELEDVGRWLFPHFKDRTSLRMLGLGYFLATGDKLVSLYAHLDMETSVARRIKQDQEIR